MYAPGGCVGFKFIIRPDSDILSTWLSLSLSHTQLFAQELWQIGRIVCEALNSEYYGMTAS